MKDTIEALIELQRIDDAIRVHKLQRDEMTANIERLKAILGRMGSELEDKRDKLVEAQRFHQEKQIDLQADGDRLARAKQKLATVTRTKEYAAMQRELDTLRKKYSEDEAELTRLSEAIEEYKRSIASEEDKLSNLEGEVEREEQASADRLRELDAAIGDVGAQKAGVRARINRSLLARYERVLDRREGKAVVSVGENGKCTGCQMRLPPQTYILVQRGETLQSCPSCQRFLYMEDYPDANFDVAELSHLQS